MTGSSEDRWRRRRRCHAELDDEPEEGKFNPGYHSDVDTEEYYNHYSSSDSDETISDSKACSVPANYGNASPSSVAVNNNGNANSSSVVAPVRACRVCGKEFHSHKAVCGHMKVHPHGRQEQGNGKDKGMKRNVAVAGDCGSTGKRGCSGLGDWAVSPNAEPDQSMAIVVAEPKFVMQPMPSAFATPNLSSVPMASAATNVFGESSSAQPMHNDAMDTVVAGAADPPTESVVHRHAAPPPAAEEKAPTVHQQPIAPPPTPAAGEQAPPVHQQPVAPPPTGRQNPNGYTCKQCNVWFPRHQGLGGHMAGHKNRELAAAAAGMLQDSAVPCRRNAKPDKTHVCKICAAEFPAGVQLGGHMRKHWNGPPIVPNKKPRLIIQPVLPPAEAVAEPPPAPTTVGVVDLTLALSVKANEASPVSTVEPAAQTGPSPAVERTPEPAPRPPVAGRVLLFGIDIGPGVQTPAAQEGSSATEGSAPTGGEQ